LIRPAEARALNRITEPVPIVGVVEESADTEGDDSEPGASVAVREPLTPRELELLRYLAEGYTNKELARAMVLAEDTVKKAVQTLIAKLGAADRIEVINPGDAFYMTPGHSPKALAGSEFVLFSPKEELAALEAHFAAVMEKMQAAETQ